MTKLTGRQELVLRLRFGQAARPVPQRQVAERLGVSLRSVRQIEHHALRRLRLEEESLISNAISGWDEV